MSNCEKYLKEDGKIKQGSKTMSVPDYDEDMAISFLVDGQEFLTQYYDEKRKEIYAFSDKYDKLFNDLSDFIQWLNKNNAKYQGYDDYK